MDLPRRTLLCCIVVWICVTCVTSEGHQTAPAAARPSCRSLAACVRLDVLAGLAKLEQSETYPLLGRRLVLEKVPGAEPSDMSRLGIVKRAYRLLDTHVVRAPITSSLALKLYRTEQGNTDVALEVGAPVTASDGRTFFKRRLQMALLPIMYKLGVMTTLLGGLVVMVMKGLVIGVILLLFAVASAVKHKILWHAAAPLHAPEPHWGYAAPQLAHHTAPQDIHLHLHGVQKDHILHRSDYAGPSSGGSGYGSGGYVSQNTAPASSGYGGGAYGAPQQQHHQQGDNSAYLSPYNRAAHNIQT